MSCVVAVGSVARVTGRVERIKWFADEARDDAHGFIRLEGIGRDLFVHRSDCPLLPRAPGAPAVDSKRTLRGLEGQEITCLVEKRRTGLWRARAVELSWRSR